MMAWKDIHIFQDESIAKIEILKNKLQGEVEHEPFRLLYKCSEPESIVHSERSKNDLDNSKFICLVKTNFEVLHEQRTQQNDDGDNVNVKLKRLPDSERENEEDNFNKRRKLTESSQAQNVVDTFDLKEKFLACITNEGSLSLDKLKENISALLLLPPNKITSVCLELKEVGLTDIFLNSVYEACCQLNFSFGFGAGVTLTLHLLFPLVADLNCSISRNLAGTIILFSTKFPKVIIEGLIVPCIENKILGVYQMDILQRIIKESLSNDDIAYCTKRVLKVLSTPDEFSLSLLAVLNDRKVILEEDCFDILTKTLCNWANDFCSNLKFSKLLINILSSCNNQTSYQIANLAAAVKVNKTFLKRSAENMLNKLKPIS